MSRQQSDTVALGIGELRARAPGMASVGQSVGRLPIRHPPVHGRADGDRCQGECGGRGGGPLPFRREAGGQGGRRYGWDLADGSELDRLAGEHGDDDLDCHEGGHRGGREGAQPFIHLSNVLSEELDSKTVGLLICLFTAARLSGMLALTWGDLDGDCLHIWRSMVKDTQQTKATKTEDERFEPCPAVLVDVLTEWKILQEQEFKAKGLRQSGETPIVSSKKGIHVLKTTFERWFRQNRVRMCLPEDFTIHGLRHTVTTILQKDIKADMTTTMSITGHKTMQMLQRYSHADDSAKRRRWMPSTACWPLIAMRRGTATAQYGPSARATAESVRAGVPPMAIRCGSLPE